MIKSALEKYYKKGEFPTNSGVYISQLAEEIRELREELEAAEHLVEQMREAVNCAPLDNEEASVFMHILKERNKL